MPIIIDANRAGDFVAPVKYHAAAIISGTKSRKIRVTVGGWLLKELMGTRLRNLISEWERVGCLVRIDNSLIECELAACGALSLRSDDLHVIALARVSGTRLLYTEDDYLTRDFKDMRILSPRGKVLTPTTPPSIVAALFRQFGG